MRRVLAMVFLLQVTSSVAAFSWRDLWMTNDQQAQDMMNNKAFSKAKDKFDDPDWRAAAAFRAGDYTAARELYQSSRHAEAEYNQGNALAHLGKYEDAIKSYDSALVAHPNDEDARYNRKLMEELLKKDKQDKDKKNQDKQDQGKQDQDKQDQDKQDQGKQDQSKQDQSKQDQNKQDQDKQDQDKQDQSKQDQDKQDQDKQDQDKQDQDKQDQDKQASPSPAEKEKQQAAEQWLRLIPDDPGGLMREKFRRDYLQRQTRWKQ